MCIRASGYTLAWAGGLLVFMTAPLANGRRLSGELGGDRRRLLWAMVAAIAISLAVSTCYTLHLAYTHGAANLHSQYFTGFAANPSKFAAQKLLHPTGPDLTGWLWTGGGVVEGATVATAGETLVVGATLASLRTRTSLTSCIGSGFSPFESKD